MFIRCFVDEIEVLEFKYGGYEVDDYGVVFIKNEDGLVLCKYTTRSKGDLNIIIKYLGASFADKEDYFSLYFDLR